MSNEAQSPTQIAHILFIDIVGYSKESINAQGRLLSELSRLVTECQTYQTAKAADQLMAFPNGDGMWILFSGDLVAPASCAAELAQHVKTTSGLSIRMGIHSGPVRFQKDISGTQNVVGDGINMANRVMNMGDDGHIVLSAQYASWLKHFEEWAPLIRPLGFGTTKHGEVLELYTLVSDKFGRADASSHVSQTSGQWATNRPKSRKIVIVYRRNAKPDDQLVAILESAFLADGHEVFMDRHLKVGAEWAKVIDEKIRAADAVIVIVSDEAIDSAMLEHELQTACEENGKRGKPHILPVRIGIDKAVDGPVGKYVNSFNFSVWASPDDSKRVIDEIKAVIIDESKPEDIEPQFELAGGAVSPDSPFYLERTSDLDFGRSLRAHESIIIVNGPRKIGKTSLIGRGAKYVREAGWRLVSTDFQKFSAAQMASDDSFYKLLAATLARQLKFKYDFAGEWVDSLGANLNLDNFIHSVVDASEIPLVWLIDDSDKLVGMPYRNDFFGLVRSWHNSRTTEPGGKWARFTVVLSYTTDENPAVQDLYQLLVNAARQIPLRSFSLDQVKDLNERYGNPLKTRVELDTLQSLLGGQPFLTRRALDVLASGQVSFSTLLSNAERILCEGLS
jgi:hypothetical protein